MRTATINKEALNRLNILTEKIRTNSASVQDYNEYEQILINSGAFTANEIHGYLSRANIHTYDALIDARNRAKTIEEKKGVETAVVVGLVALGLAIIFASGSKK